MIWLFWGLLAGLLGGMFFLALLARRGRRSRLRPTGPSSIQLLQALGQSFLGVLWIMSHPFGHRYGSHRRYNFDPSRYEFDPSKEFVREHERELEEERRRRSDQD